MHSMMPLVTLAALLACLAGLVAGVAILVVSLVALGPLAIVIFIAGTIWLVLRTLNKLRDYVQKNRLPDSLE